MRMVRYNQRKKLLVWVLLVVLFLQTGYIPGERTVSAATQMETLTIDFENGNNGFVGRGDAIATITEEYAYSGACMSVSGGSEGWHGVERELSDILSGDVVLTVSAYVRNNEEYEIKSHMTLQEEKEDGSVLYTWIQGDVLIAPGEWTMLSGTVEVNSDTVRPVLYFETAEAGVSFSIDQVEITVEQKSSEEIEDVPDPEFDVNYTKGHVIDFEDGKIYFDTLGEPELSITENKGYKKSKGLLVEERSESYEGPLKELIDLIERGTTIAGTSVSASALVKNHAEESRWTAITLRLTKFDGSTTYQNLAWATAEAGSWVQLSSTSIYTIGEDVEEAAIYIEVEGTDPFTIDCVNLVTKAGDPGNENPNTPENPNDPENPDTPENPSDPENPNTPGNPNDSENPVEPGYPQVVPFDELKIDFEDGNTWFTNRGDGIAMIAADAFSGEKCLSVTGRTLKWHGVEKDFSTAALSGKGMEISSWVKNVSSYPIEIYITLQETDAQGNVTYTRIAGCEALPGSWTKLAGSVNVQFGTVQSVLYYEANDPTAAFLMDDVILCTIPWIEELKNEVLENEAPVETVYNGMPEEVPTSPSGAESVEPFTSLKIDFEDGDSFFGNRGDGKGVISNQSHSGERALSVTGRTVSWHGVERDFSDAGLQGKVLQVSFWTKHEKSEAQEIRFCIMEESADGEITYNWIAGEAGIRAGEWINITGEYLVNEAAEKILLYFEATDPQVSFLLDDIELKVASSILAEVEEFDGNEEPEKSEDDPVWVKNKGNTYIETITKSNTWKWPLVIGVILVISVTVLSMLYQRKKES